MKMIAFDTIIVEYPNAMQFSLPTRVKNHRPAFSRVYDGAGHLYQPLPLY